VLERCVEQELTLVTHNAKDFKTLIQRQKIHRGLIIFPSAGRAKSKELPDLVIAHLETLGDLNMSMINKILEIDRDGAIAMYALP